ncbi:hypothetical protein [Persephonella sp.]
MKHKYKIVGINLIITEDKSYTSKTSSVSGDIEKKKFNGKRTKRGFFKDHMKDL